MKQLISSKFLILALIICKISVAQTDRLQWQPPEQIMDSIGIKSGMIIGEIGAGKGYFTLPLSKRVGDNGKVYANDIKESSLDILRTKCKNEDINNVEIVVGETEDPLFPDIEYDMMIMVYVLHHLDKPVKFLKNLEKYMDSGIPIVIIEQRREHDRSHYHDFMSESQILEVMKETNFKMTKKYTFLQKDNIYVFELKN